MNEVLSINAVYCTHLIGVQLAALFNYFLKSNQKVLIKKLICVYIKWTCTSSESNRTIAHQHGGAAVCVSSLISCVPVLFQSLALPCVEAYCPPPPRCPIISQTWGSLLPAYSRCVQLHLMWVVNTFYFHVLLLYCCFCIWVPPPKPPCLPEQAVLSAGVKPPDPACQTEPVSINMFVTVCAVCWVVIIQTFSKAHKL